MRRDDDSIFRPRMAALHLFVLASLGLTARLYAMLGDRPMFFAVRQGRAVDLVFLVVVLSLLLPGALVAVEWLAGRLGTKFRGLVHLVLVGLLSTAIALPPCKQIGLLNEPAILALAEVIGVAAAVAYARVVAVRTLVTILCPILVISPGLFLLHSPARKFLTRWREPQPLAVEVDRPAPVVFVVFDEMSGVSLMDARRQIDRQRFPNLAALADDGTWYRNASAAYGDTETALPVLLTGCRPHPGINEPDAYEYDQTLFTLLAGSHTLQVEESGTALCPAAWCGRTEPRMTLGRRWWSLVSDLAVLELVTLLPADWPMRLPEVRGRWGFYWGECWDESEEGPFDPIAQRVRVPERAIDAIQASERPAFFFLHAELPHAPWTFTPSGKRYDAVMPDLGAAGRQWIGLNDIVGLNRQTLVWSDDSAAVALALQRYRFQAGCVDRLVGRLIERLKAVGLYDRSLIIITADHGVAFAPGHPIRPIDAGSGPALMSIPLVVKLPGRRGEAGVSGNRNPKRQRGLEIGRTMEQVDSLDADESPVSGLADASGCDGVGRPPGRVSDRNVDTFDLVPTVADVLGIRLPWQSEGQSLLDESVPERPRKEIRGGPGSDARWSCDARFEEKYAALKRLMAQADQSRSPLVGRRVDQLGRSGTPCLTSPPPGTGCLTYVADNASGARLRVELAGAERFADVHPVGPRLPCYVSGRILGRGDGSQPLELAIAVNGTIRAVTRTFTLPGLEDTWAAVVPEESFVEGANEVRVYVVWQRENGLIVAPMEMEK